MSRLPPQKRCPGCATPMARVDEHWMSKPAMVCMPCEFPGRYFPRASDPYNRAAQQERTP